MKDSRQPRPCRSHGAPADPDVAHDDRLRGELDPLSPGARNDPDRSRDLHGDPTRFRCRNLVADRAGSHRRQRTRRQLAVGLQPVRLRGRVLVRLRLAQCRHGRVDPVRRGTGHHDPVRPAARGTVHVSADGRLAARARGSRGADAARRHGAALGGRDLDDRRRHRVGSVFADGTRQLRTRSRRRRATSSGLRCSERC